MTDHGGTSQAQARQDVRVFAVPVRRLVQVHEVHVDAVPRNFDIGLGRQVQQGLAQDLEASDPHLRGAKGVHPGDDAEDTVVRAGLKHRSLDGVGILQDGLPYDRHRQQVRFVEQAHNLARLLGDLRQRFLAVQILAAGDEPDLAALIETGHGEISFDVSAVRRRFGSGRRGSRCDAVRWEREARPRARRARSWQPPRPWRRP